MKNLIRPVIFCTLLISCNKEDNEPKSLDTFVEGRVLTVGTDDPATTEPRLIKLMHEEATSIFGGKEITVDETHTDENGYYSFSFTARNDYTRYFVRLTEGASNHSGPPVHNRHFLDIGKHQTRNIYLSPHAWLKLHIKNVNPQPGDELFVIWDSYQRKFYGPVNQEIILKGGGNINRKIYYNLLRNNEWHALGDTIWMPAWDTTYHKFEY